MIDFDIQVFVEEYLDALRNFDGIVYDDLTDEEDEQASIVYNALIYA